MKYFLAILIIIISACTCNKNNKQAGTEGERKIDTCDSTHIITYQQATDYMALLLAHSPLCRRAKTIAFGGYLDSMLFFSHSMVEVPAYKFFPCYDNDSVYLAFEEIDRYKCEDTACGPDDDKYLRRSSNTFKFDRDVDYESIQNFLESQSGDTGMVSDTIKGSDVRKYAKEFYDEYDTNNVVNHMTLCGAFSKKEVDSLLRQEYPKGTRLCKGLRYFFGYDMKRNGNKLRLILIGVKPNGENLLRYSDGREALMFEKNWPPDFH